MAWGLGYFPGTWFRFGGREARRLVRDWSRQGRTGQYRIEGSERDYETLLARLRVPVLAVSFTDDSYCPQRAVEHLLDKMPNAATSHQHLASADLGSSTLGHFGWVRQADRLAPRILDWLHQQSFVSSPAGSPKRMA